MYSLPSALWEALTERGKRSGSHSPPPCPQRRVDGPRRDVNPGYEKDYYRFFMKRGLNWDEIKEMMNYGVGIAFHDVMAENVNDVEEIKQHYGIAQSKIQEQLAGRKCKMLARPNGKTPI